MARTSTEAYCAGPTEPILELSVGDLLRAAAEDSPDKQALVEGTPDPATRRRWTYAQLYADAERCARALLRRYEPGDRIGIWAPNIAEYQLLQYGCALAGMTIVTVNPTFRLEEARYTLERSRAVACFTVEEFRGREPFALASEISTSAEALRDVIAFEHWETFLAESDPGAALPAVDPWSTAQILFTSGTTGFPKGAMLPHVGMTNNVRHGVFRIAAGAEVPAVWLAVLPMFHLAGCVVAAVGSIALRGTLLTVRDFDPELALSLVEEEKVTTTNLVATMMLAMLQHKSYQTRDLDSLRSVYLGGGPIPPVLVRRLESQLGIVPIVGYGLTEAAIVTTTSADDDPEDRATTCGRPIPGVEVRLVEPKSGQPVRFGEVGEMQTRGAHTMLGYFEDPEATKVAFTEDGWMRTGDLCTLDDRGYLRVVGRAKEMIIRGGENIYPREIEDELLRHDAIAEAAVIGLPDDYYGEIVAAFVRLREGYEITAVALRDVLRERLTGHKVPTRWFVVSEYPKTPSGKIKKGEVRQLWERGEYPETPV